MDYHAHIYWASPEQRDQALQIRETLKGLGCKVGQVHEVPIGPHPLPMFQVAYNSNMQDSVEELLVTMRQDLSVLLHESINDDVRDHTEGARWFGEKLSLDLVWLDEYTKGR